MEKKKKVKNKPEVSTVRQAKHGGVLSAVFGIICLLWISPMEAVKNLVSMNFRLS